MTPKSVVLFNQLNGSDKEYHIELRPEGDGWMVHFRYGKRGNASRGGTKTQSPVSYKQASAVYDKILKGQLADGYTIGEGGVAYADVPEKSFTGVLPQLLNPIDEAELPELIANDDWVAQEKHDGERVMILVTETDVIGINRKGVQRPLPVALIAHVRNASTVALFDGELVGDVYFAFDILELRGKDLRGDPYVNRLHHLYHFVGGKLPKDAQSSFVPTTTAYTSDDKRAIVERMRAAGREGVVWKLRTAPYAPGRPGTGGPQRKFKFVESATLEVTAVSAGKRSVSLAAYDADQPVPVGNVTIPANHAVPAPGTIVEVQYLYAFRNGSLFQPVYKGPRPDQDREACGLSQLKFKDEPPPHVEQEATRSTRRARA
jgi:bifunctional non-homologous end joining protein LigD